MVTCVKAVECASHSPTHFSTPFLLVESVKAYTPPPRIDRLSLCAQGDGTGCLRVRELWIAFLSLGRDPLI